jgi:hypothetical protein
MSLSGFAGALGAAVTASEPRSIESGARADQDTAPPPDTEPFSSSLARANAGADGERRGTAEEVHRERPVKSGGISKDTRRNKQQLPEPPAPAQAAVKIELATGSTPEQTSALTPLYSARLKSNLARSAPDEHPEAPAEILPKDAPDPATGEAPAPDQSPTLAAPTFDAYGASGGDTARSPVGTPPSQAETPTPAASEDADGAETAARTTEAVDLAQAAATLTASPQPAAPAPTSGPVAPAPTPVYATELELNPDAELPRGRIGLAGTAITLGEGEQQITVTIRMDGHKVYLAASARSDDLLKILAQHRGELRQFLGQHGLALESFSATASRHESSNGAEEPREGGGASELATEDDGPPERRGRARVRVVV